MFRTIQGKYTAIIIFTVTIFLAGMLVINYSLLRSHSLASAEETARIILNNADNQIDLLFESIRALTESVARQTVVKEVDVDRMRELFISNILPRQDYIRALYLGTADGRMYEWGVGPGFIDHTPTFPDDYDPRKRPWYQTGLEADEYTLTVPYLYASVNALGITAVHPVYNGDEFVGILGLDLILDGLQNLVDSLRIQKDGKILLLTRNLQILVNQFDPNPVLAKELEQFPLPELLEDNQPSHLAQMDGGRFLVCHTVNESSGLILLLYLPYDQILSFSQENLKIILFFDILLMLLLGILVTFLSRRIITNPLNEIISVMRKMERGDVTVRIPQMPGEEFSLIAKLFNNLSDISLESSKRMEEKVQARTKDVLRLQKENIRLRIIEEKERIYTNLHDSLGARLTGINISNNVAKSALRRNELALVEEMHNRIERNTQQGIKDIRDILIARDPEVLTGEDIIQFIGQQMKERLELKDIAFTCKLPAADRLEILGSDLLCDLKRIIQELVTNALKHSQAYHVSLAINMKNKRLFMVYTDDGEGFDVKEAVKKGYGLPGLYNRAEKMGGYLKIISKPGKGVRLELHVRLEDS